MINKKYFAGIQLTLLFIVQILVYGQELGYKKMADEGTRKQEYYFAFTEATKYFLLGNFVQATSLYKECLKMFPESGTVHFQLSRIFLNTGNIALAREHAKKACSLSKDNQWFLQELAAIYQMEEKIDSAILIYKELLRLNDDDINSAYAIASLTEKKGNYDEALYYLNLVDNKIGASKEVLVSRFRVYEAQRKPEEAIKELKKAYTLSEEDYSIAGIIAEFFRDRNIPDSAMKYYQLIYPLYKSDPVVGFSYSEFLLKNGNRDSAQKVLIEILNDKNIENSVKSGYFYKIAQNEKELELTKPILDTITAVYFSNSLGDVRSMAIYTDIQLKLKNYGKAVIALVRIVSKDESNYPAFEQLVYVLNILGKTDSVIHYSNIAIERFDSNPVFYLFNGAAKFQNKDFREATKVLEKGLSNCRTIEMQLEFYSMLAECYESIGEHEKSENAFNAALSLDRNNYGILNNYSYYLSLRSKNLAAARKMSRMTIKSEPTNSTYLDTYAWILFKMNRRHKAEKIIKRAIEYGGKNNIEILLHYGEILISLKRDGEALLLLNEAVKLADEDEKTKILEKIKLIEKSW